MLKETPPGHPDRMALQLALTTLESLAEMLNERKREAEQFAAFREKMRNISAGGKFSGGNNRAALLTSPVAGSSDGANGYCNGGSGAPNRFLLKEDDMTQLEFNTSGLITRSKQRRLLLLNDLLLCVTVNGRSSEVDFNPVSSANSNERLSLKWAVPVGDVEIVGEFSNLIIINHQHTLGLFYMVQCIPLIRPTYIRPSRINGQFCGGPNFRP